MVAVIFIYVCWSDTLFQIKKTFGLPFYIYEGYKTIHVSGIITSRLMFRPNQSVSRIRPALMNSLEPNTVTSIMVKGKARRGAHCSRWGLVLHVTCPQLAEACNVRTEHMQQTWQSLEMPWRTFCCLQHTPSSMTRLAVAHQWCGVHFIGIRYWDEILRPLVRPYSGVVGTEFLLI